MPRAGFSDTVIDHFQRPRCTGALEQPTGEGWGGHIESSRYMRIQIRLEGERITDARFGTYGCAPAIACGSYLCDWAIGRTTPTALHYSSDDLNHALGDLPPARRFCADLAVDALREAIRDAASRPLASGPGPPASTGSIHP